MASIAGLAGIGLPSFSDQMPEVDARALKNYLYQLNEQLTYVLTNRRRPGRRARPPTCTPRRGRMP